MIHDDFVDVIKRTADRVPFSCDYGAAGCGSCFRTDADAALFWVAQNDATESVALNYGQSDHTQDLISTVEEVAEEMGVPVSIPPNDGYTIMLGVEGYYVDLEPGTPVRRNERYRNGRGIVVNPDVINETECDHEVRKGGYSGDVVAKFEDKSDAERFIRNSTDDLSIYRSMEYGSSPGDNIVLFEGNSKPSRVSTSSLRVIEDEDV